MTKVYNEELLKKAGLTYITEEDGSITIYEVKDITNGFKDGDIIAKKSEYNTKLGIKYCLCRYRGFEGKALLTDEFYIRRKNGQTEKGKRAYPTSGFGYIMEYRKATKEEEDLFNKELLIFD